MRRLVSNEARAGKPITSTSIKRKRVGVNACFHTFVRCEDLSAIGFAYSLRFEWCAIHVVQSGW